MSDNFGMLSLYVRDMEKAKAFYVDFLGMEVVEAFSGPSFILTMRQAREPVELRSGRY